MPNIVCVSCGKRHRPWQRPWALIYDGHLCDRCSFELHLRTIEALSTPVKPKTGP
jgi:hypothetical protein